MQPFTSTFYTYLKRYAAKDPDKPLLFNEERSLSVGETHRAVLVLAARLQKCGIGRGDMVALRTTRSLDACVIFFALEALGAVAVLTDPHFTASRFLKDCGVSMPIAKIVTNEKASSDISACGGWTVSDPDGSRPCALDLYGGGDPLPEEQVEGDYDKPAVIIFTSGSTGGSKAVTLSQNNVVNNSEGTRYVGWYLPEDVNMLLLPIHHVFGLALLASALVLEYAVLVPVRTDVDYILQCIEKYRVTRMNGVPTLYLAMAAHNAGGKYDVSSFRTGLIGGGPCTPEQFVLIERELGITLVPVYGMSEYIGICCGDWRDSLDLRKRGVGRVYELTDVRFVGDDGREVPRGQTGEIFVKGPVKMLYYYGNEEETAGVTDGDGWLKTGDLGFLDPDGIVHLNGRKKDLIIRGGENISCAKIERALLSLPFVFAAAVVGVADGKYGELPCALVVLKEGEARTEEEIKSALAGSLSKIELPEKIVACGEIPKTSSCKTDKMKIKEMFEKWRKA